MPVPLFVIGGIAAFLLLLLFCPIRVTLSLKEEVRLTLRVLGIPILLFPRKKKVVLSHYTKEYLAKAEEKRRRKEEKKAAKKQKKAEKKQKKSAARKSGEPHKKEKTPLRANLALVRGLLSALIRGTRGHLYLRCARIHIRVATGDAATTAITYGAVSAGLSYLLAALKHTVNLKTKAKDIAVFADYLGETSKADLKLVFGISPAGALAILFPVAFAFLKGKKNIKNAKKQKGLSPQKG